VEKIKRYYVEASHVVSAMKVRKKEIDSKLKEIDEYSELVPSLI